MAEIRTAIVKSLEDYFWYAVAATNQTIPGARMIGQICDLTDTNTATETILAARGAGHTGTTISAYAVALTAINTALVVTKATAQTAIFVAGDPPYTAIPFSGAIDDIVDTPTSYAVGTAGDRVAIVEQPPTYSGGLLSFVTALGIEPGKSIRRDIRDRGVLQHRKMNAWPHAGVASFTSLYENAKRGLSAFVDRDFILVGEREDNRGQVVTEKVVLYGCHIPAIPTPSEQSGENDSEIVINVSYELMAVVGETV